MSSRGQVAGFIIPDLGFLEPLPIKKPAKEHPVKSELSAILKRTFPWAYRMKAKKSRMRPSPNEEAQLIKQETERRRKLRLQQVRQQCKENAAKVRHAVKEEKHRQLVNLATDIHRKLEAEKNERIHLLEMQYENSLRSIGLGHKEAGEQVDQSEERELMFQVENLRAQARGRAAIERQKREQAQRDLEKTKTIVARKSALDVERERAAEIAAMPPPPPDPVLLLEKNKNKPVKVMDVNAFSSTHYHILEEFAVDRADPDREEDARRAAEEEQERMQERSRELKRLHQDQLETARVRHNQALEKELLSHDYNHILHELSDLQRADRDRRQKIVHNIPKQVFEPPHHRMNDIEEHQKQLEQEFEDMYMAGTDYMGDISLALDPHPPQSPGGTESQLDDTGASARTPIQEPSLPAVPPVLKDMTNTPHKVPGKKPEKVLRKLMDKIKNQRQEWMSRSLMEMSHGEDEHSAEGEGDKGGEPVLSEHTMSEVTSPEVASGQQSPPEKLARVQSPVTQSRPVHGAGVKQPLMHPMELAAKIRSVQSENLQKQPVVTAGKEVEKGIENIMKEQEAILQQKQQLEEKLRQLHENQKALLQSSRLAMAEAPPSQEPDLPGPGKEGPPMPQFPQLVPHLTNSQSSTGTQPMNSIPPTRTTSTGPLTSAPAFLVPTIPSGTAFHAGDKFQPSVASAFVNTGQGVGITGPGVSSTGPALGSVEAQPTLSGQPPGAGIDQLRKVRQYQEQLLVRHEQSKKVLEETRNEIERRKQHLVQRFPQLDLSRLEQFGAKYLESDLQGEGLQPTITAGTHVTADDQSKQQEAFQTKVASVSSILASLASHPYYASRLTEPLSDKERLELQSRQSKSSVEDSKKHYSNKEPPKTKMDSVRKSLPFDADDSVLSPAVRTQMQQMTPSADVTMGTEGDTTLTTSTDGSSPALPSGGRRGFIDFSEGDTSLSFEIPDPSRTRRDELQRQLAEIQRQKEAIIRRQEEDSLRLQKQQEELKAKLSQITPEELGIELKNIHRQKEEIVRQYGQDVTGTDTSDRQQDDYNMMISHQATLKVDSRPHDLSVIHEVDTPISTARPSDGTSGRPSLSSSEGGTSFHSQRSLHFPPVSQTIVEEEDAERGYSQGFRGQMDDVEDVLERARKFDDRVLENLRQQTNSVFDTIGEFESRDDTYNKRLTGAQSLSSHSVTPESFSAGPVGEESFSNGFTVTRKDTSMDRLSQKSSRSWAAELSQYSLDRDGAFQSGNQSGVSDESWSFKVLKPEESKSSELMSLQNGPSTMFNGEVDRFRVYRTINEPSFSSLPRLDDKIVGLQQYSLPDLKNDLSERTKEKSHLELSQYSLPDKSAVSLGVSHSLPISDVQQSHDLSGHTGSSGSFKELPARLSPVGNLAQVEIGGFKFHTGPDGGIIDPSSSQALSEHSISESEGDRSSPAVIKASKAMSDKPLQQTQIPRRREETLGASLEISSKDNLRPQTRATKSLDMHQRVEALGRDREASSLPSVTARKQEQFSLGNMSAETSYGGMSVEPSLNLTTVSALSEHTIMEESRMQSKVADSMVSNTSSDTGKKFLEEKFANLDQLISESRNLIARHKSLIDKNKDLESRDVPDREPAVDKRVSVEAPLELKGSKSLEKKNRESGGFPSPPHHVHADDTRDVHHTASPSVLQTDDDTSKMSSYDITESSARKSDVSQSKLSSFDITESPARKPDTSQSKLSSFSNIKIQSDSDFSALTRDQSSDLDIDHSKFRSEGQSNTARTTSLYSGDKSSVFSKLIDGEMSQSKSLSELEMSKMSSLDSSSMDKLKDPSKMTSFDISNQSSLGAGPSLTSSEVQDSFKYLSMEAGITDEPNLTLVTTDSEMSITEEVSKADDGDTDSEDSLRSFEQLEEAVELNSFDRLKNGDRLKKVKSGDTINKKENKREDRNTSASSLKDAFEQKRKIFGQPQEQTTSVKDRAPVFVGDRKKITDTASVFRAVPVMAGPTLSLSMKVSSGTAQKSAVTKSDEFKSEKSDVRSGKPTDVPTAKSDSFRTFKTPPEVAKKPQDTKHKEKEFKSVALNRALQPRGKGGQHQEDATSGAKPKFQRSTSAPAQRSSGSDVKLSPIVGLGSLANDIRQFGGSAGLNGKQKSAVAAKPKENEPVKSAAGLSKTLSSWKKSRSIKSAGPTPQPIQSKAPPKSSVKVLPADAPSPKTEEERQQSTEDEAYERKMRAYNPRLFRLANKLTESQEEEEKVLRSSKEKKDEEAEGQYVQCASWSMSSM